MGEDGTGLFVSAEQIDRKCLFIESASGLCPRQSSTFLFNKAGGEIHFTPITEVFMNKERDD